MKILKTLINYATFIATNKTIRNHPKEVKNTGFMSNFGPNFDRFSDKSSLYFKTNYSFFLNHHDYR